MKRSAPYVQSTKMTVLHVKYFKTHKRLIVQVYRLSSRSKYDVYCKIRKNLKYILESIKFKTANCCNKRQYLRKFDSILENFKEV